MLVSGTRRSSRRMDYGRLSYMCTQCFNVPKCALDAPLYFPACAGTASYAAGEILVRVASTNVNSWRVACALTHVQE